MVLALTAGIIGHVSLADALAQVIQRIGDELEMQMVAAEAQLAARRLDLIRPECGDILPADCGRGLLWSGSS
ncbi:MAG: hypothetical protein CL916_01600, partial [Deltaproteobacteria bacterium]|nr:hypothetical protein [Deltaproteobacteria bacterium]